MPFTLSAENFSVDRGLACRIGYQWHKHRQYKHLWLRVNRSERSRWLWELTAARSQKLCLKFKTSHRCGKSRSRTGHRVVIEHGSKAGWLAPIALAPPRKKVREKSNARRASNKGCLSMSLDQYLRLLDWTGRQIRAKKAGSVSKAGSIPADCAPILERLELNAETWLDVVRNFRKRFRTEAGLRKNRQSFRSTRRASRTQAATS